jgi:hypothetical protein
LPHRLVVDLQRRAGAEIEPEGWKPGANTASSATVTSPPIVPRPLSRAPLATVVRPLAALWSPFTNR